MEYAKNDVANSRTYVETYNKMLEYTNGTWIHENVLAPNFGPKVGRKVVGERLIFWILIPVVLNGIVVLLLTLNCLCKCMSGTSDNASDSKST